MDQYGQQSYPPQYNPLIQNQGGQQQVNPPGMQPYPSQQFGMPVQQPMYGQPPLQPQPPIYGQPPVQPQQPIYGQPPVQGFPQQAPVYQGQPIQAPVQPQFQQQTPFYQAQPFQQPQPPVFQGQAPQFQPQPPIQQQVPIQGFPILPQNPVQVQPTPMLCNNRHAMRWCNHNPYPGAVAVTCDNCRRDIACAYWFHHCDACGQDFCQSCRPQTQPQVNIQIQPHNPHCYCVNNHQMQWLNRNPYPGACAVTCDICRRDIAVQYWYHHCQTCQVDFCQGCGKSRIR